MAQQLINLKIPIFQKTKNVETIACVLQAAVWLGKETNRNTYTGTSSCIQNKSQLRTSTSKSHLATIRRIIGSQHKTKLEKDGNTCVQSREGCRRGWGEGVGNIQ